MTETGFSATESTLRSTFSPQVAEVWVRYAEKDVVVGIVAGMTHAVVPGLAFSSATLGQLVGQGSTGAATDSAAAGSMTAGGAMSGSRPEVLARMVPSLL